MRQIKPAQLAFGRNIIMIIYLITYLCLVTIIFTQRRSVAKSVGCFQRRLFVCLFVNTITSERVNRMMKLGEVGGLYKNLGRV